MVKRNRWTAEEDEILVQAIKANPNNKREAFRIASQEVEHNEKSCAARWYKVLSNPYHKKYVGCMFTMVGVSSKYNNRTVYRSDSKIHPTRIRRNLWDTIKKLLGII